MNIFLDGDAWVFVGMVIFDCLSGWSYNWMCQVLMVVLTRKNCSKHYYKDMKDRTGNHFFELEWRRMISFTANKIIEENLQASFKWIPSIDVDFWSDTSTNYWCGKNKIIEMSFCFRRTSINFEIFGLSTCSLVICNLLWSLSQDILGDDM